MVSHILEDYVDFPNGVFMNTLRHENCPGFGQRLKPRRDIDAIAEDVAAFDDDVALMEPDAKLDASILGFAGIVFGDRPQHLDGAT